MISSALYPLISRRPAFQLAIVPAGIEHEYGVVADTADQQAKLLLAAPEIVLELGAHDDILLQRPIGLLELLRPHRTRGARARRARWCSASFARRALPDDGAQHQPGNRDNTDKGEQQQQRRVDRGRSERAAAENRIDDRDRAQRGNGSGDFELVEAQRGPDDQRKCEQQAAPAIGGRRSCRCRIRHSRRSPAPARSWSLRAFSRSACARGTGRPEQDDRRHDDDAGHVALPPRPPVGGEIGSSCVCRRAVIATTPMVAAMVDTTAADRDEIEHFLAAFEAARQRR